MPTIMPLDPDLRHRSRCLEEGRQRTLIDAVALVHGHSLAHQPDLVIAIIDLAEDAYRRGAETQADALQPEVTRYSLAAIGIPS